MIKFVCSGGPYGDATSNYNVEFPEGWTLRDFCAHVLHDYAVKNKEWGSVSSGFGYENTIIEYDSKKAWIYQGEHWMDSEKRHELFENSKRLYNEYIDKKIVAIRANGGWSVMHYDLTFEPEEPSYANYEVGGFHEDSETDK